MSESCNSVLLVKITLSGEQVRGILGCCLATLLVLPLERGAHGVLKRSQAADNATTRSFRAFGLHYGRWLIAAFDSIPADRYGYKPTSAQQTVGFIAQHLENANYELCARFSSAKPPQEAGDSTLADSIKAAWPKDTLVRRLKTSLTFCDNAMTSLADASLNDDVPVDPPASDRRLLRARFLLAFVTDLAEHYSQIAGYMRLNGMTPPSAVPQPTRDLGDSYPQS